MSSGRVGRSGMRSLVVGRHISSSLLALKSIAGQALLVLLLAIL
jgi:hypothetical protein